MQGEGGGGEGGGDGVGGEGGFDGLVEGHCLLLAWRGRARRHNNQPSDSIAGKEEMLMEGDVAMEAETAFPKDLSVGVVLQKIYEELSDA